MRTKNIYSKQIEMTLIRESGLGMNEVVGGVIGQQLGATRFRGSQPIDGIWATPDTVVTNLCVMPAAGHRVGDHRLFVVDFLISSLVSLPHTH